MKSVKKTFSNLNRTRKKISLKKIKNYLSDLNRIRKGLAPKNRLPEPVHIDTYTYRSELDEKNVRNEIANFTYKPLISIVIPVYNVDPIWLEKAISSVENQLYNNWEICIADDCSTNLHTLNFLKSINNHKINVRFLDKNVNISAASNAALDLAKGDYVGLLDNDDELTPDALFEVVKLINETNAEFIYSDEDKLDMDGKFCHPYYKPDFSLHMFLSNNYLCHFTVIKTEIIKSVGGFEVGLEGSQDYDLFLKCSEKVAKIYHIPKILYHWRMIPGSTASEFSSKSYAQENGRKALENYLKRQNIIGEVLNGKFPGTYQIKREILGNPLVSIIIPFYNKPELLQVCIDSILEKTTYSNFEIIGISNNSTDEAVFELMNFYQNLDNRISFIEYNVPFNYSKINNYAVSFAKGEHLILLNNDIEIISNCWIESMLGLSQIEDVGAVGAKLYYPNDTIQHAGVTIGVLGLAGHSHKNLPKDHPGYFAKNFFIHNVSAVTAACLMVKKCLFEKVNGLNEEVLAIAFNDVDLCLRLLEIGYYNIFTPYSEAYHHESVSRGLEDDDRKIARFVFETSYMRYRHFDILQKGDPYYNVNLTRDHEDYSLR